MSAPDWDVIRKDDPRKHGPASQVLFSRERNGTILYDDAAFTYHELRSADWHLWELHLTFNGSRSKRFKGKEAETVWEQLAKHSRER